MCRESRYVETAIFFWIVAAAVVVEVEQQSTYPTRRSHCGAGVVKVCSLGAGYSEAKEALARVSSMARVHLVCFLEQMLGSRCRIFC